MNKKMIIALILIGLSAVILIVNRGALDGITVDLIVMKIHAAKSMVLLGAVALGVLIGVLLK